MKIRNILSLGMLGAVSLVAALKITNPNLILDPSYRINRLGANLDHLANYGKYGVYRALLPFFCIDQSELTGFQLDTSLDMRVPTLLEEKARKYQEIMESQESEEELIKEKQRLDALVDTFHGLDSSSTDYAKKVREIGLQVGDSDLGFYLENPPEAFTEEMVLNKGAKFFTTLTGEDLPSDLTVSFTDEEELDGSVGRHSSILEGIQMSDGSMFPLPVYAHELGHVVYLGGDQLRVCGAPLGFSEFLLFTGKIYGEGGKSYLEEAAGRLFELANKGLQERNESSYWDNYTTLSVRVSNVTTLDKETSIDHYRGSLMAESLLVHFDGDPIAAFNYMSDKATFSLFEEAFVTFDGDVDVETGAVIVDTYRTLRNFWEVSEEDDSENASLVNDILGLRLHLSDLVIYTLYGY